MLAPLAFAAPLHEARASGRHACSSSEPLRVLTKEGAGTVEIEGCQAAQANELWRKMIEDGESRSSTSTTSQIPAGWTSNAGRAATDTFRSTTQT